LKSRRDAFVERIEALKEKTNELEIQQQKYSGLELDLELAKQHYLLYGNKTEDSRMYAMRNKTNISSVVISQRAVRPEKAKSPKPLLAFWVSMFLGIIAAFLLPFILETVDNKIKVASDIEAAFSIPVIGSYREI